jgi:CelD/BcsL family acetyltransferase involved in cellulose biosynthesis
VIRTEVRDALGDVAPAWDAFVDAAPLPSPFLRSWWLEGVAGVRGQFAVVRDDDEPIGGLALERDRPLGVSRLRPVGLALASDHFDLVAAPGREEEVQALDAWLRDSGARVVDLVGCYEEPRIARALSGPRIEVIDVAPWQPLPADFDEYMAARSRELRSGIDRPTRRLRREGVVHRVVPPDDSRHALTELRRLHTQVFGDSSLFLPVFERFARAAKVGMARGELVVNEFCIDDRAIAVNVCFQVAGRLSYYQSGRDTDRRWRGAGTALIGHCVEQAIDSGCREFDLLRGSEAYKRQWATRERKILRMRAARGIPGWAAAGALATGLRAKRAGASIRSGARRLVRRTATAD